jgi:hypothetical protein
MFTSMIGSLDLERAACGVDGGWREHVLPRLLDPGAALGAALVGPVLVIGDVGRAGLGRPGIGLAPSEDNVVDVAASKLPVLVVAHGERGDGREWDG